MANRPLEVRHGRVLGLLRPLLIAAGVVIALIAACALGEKYAHAQTLELDYATYLADEAKEEAQPTEDKLAVADLSQEVEYTTELSWSERSNFKLFGNTATPKPIASAVFSVDFGAWDVLYINTQGLGSHPRGIGAIADYHDVLVGRSEEKERTTLYVGTEIFYSPSQLQGGQLIFFAPLVTASTDWTDSFSTLIGVQAGEPINSVYSGAQVFGWAEVTLSRTWGRVTPKLTLGGAGDNLERVTGYVVPKIELAFGDATAYVAGLRAWSRNTDGQRSIEFTPTVGIAYDFFQRSENR